MNRRGEHEGADVPPDASHRCAAPKTQPDLLYETNKGENVRKPRRGANRGLTVPVRCWEPLLGRMGGCRMVSARRLPLYLLD